MEDINPMDEAQLRHEMRDLYREFGAMGATQALYEMLLAANILAEVMIEEQNKENLDAK